MFCILIDFTFGTQVARQQRRRRRRRLFSLFGGGRRQRRRKTFEINHLSVAQAGGGRTKEGRTEGRRMSDSLTECGAITVPNADAAALSHASQDEFN